MTGEAIGQSAGSCPPKRTVGGVVALLVLLVSLLPADLRGQVPPEAGHSPLAGSRVYGSSGCGECHSVRGYGADRAPDLGRVEGPRSFFTLGAAMWNHLPGQLDEIRGLGLEPAPLSAGDAGDLIAFLFTLDYFDPAGDPDAGRRLFRRKRCLECHQVEGRGGVVGPNLDFLRLFSSPIQVAAAMWNHGPRMTEEQRRRGIRRPRFSRGEFLDLIAYLESGSPGVPGRPLYVLPGESSAGEQLFRRKHCIECHGAPGAGGGVGPDLARRARGESLMGVAAAMWNHQPEMLEEARRRSIDIPTLSPEEMADLIAYLFSIQYFSGAGSPGRGRTLVRTSGCLSCHGGDGKPAGGELTGREGFDTQAAVVAALWNHLRVAIRDRVPPERWPVFDARQVADLTAFLQRTSRTR